MGWEEDRKALMLVARAALSATEPWPEVDELEAAMAALPQHIKDDLGRPDAGRLWFLERER